MVSFVQLFAVILAGLAVAIADALIKKTSIQGDFILALKNPWIIAVLILYAVQILLFIYVFTHNWQLGIVGNIQMVVYAISVVLMGIVFFEEALSLVKVAGIVLGLIAIVFMNL